MEYQRIINLLDNMPNQTSKFKITNWFQINDEPRRTYPVQIRSKTSISRSSFWNYSDTYKWIHIYLLKEL